jgi:5-(carboxyamino)imidazole ribonucleotide synthase
MTVQAAIPLGITVQVLAASPDDSAALVCPTVILGPPDGPEALDRLAAASDVITFDHELVDVGQLRRLEAAGQALHPSAATMAVAQDKGEQHRRFAAAGLPVPAHTFVSGVAELIAFGKRHGWPVVAKACRGGYDGRGVWVLPEPHAAQQLLDRAAAAGIGLLVERWVPIEREIAVLVARRGDGTSAVYPVVETVQRDGICHEVLAPAPLGADLTAAARRLALAVAEAVDVTGILAVEIFVTEGTLMVNEIATRPHNSGHFSIEGCVTSQFENHLRAILGWPLGSTALTAPAAAMANILAGPNPVDLAGALPEALAIEGVHVHLYGKAPRPGRKVGHVTALGDDIGDARERAVRAAAVLTGRAPAHITS